MFRQYDRISLSLVLFVAIACAGHRQLSQADAEKTIRVLAAARPFEFPGGANQCSFTSQGITNIDRVSQFSENEASTIVTIQCRNGYVMNLKASFQKDINAKWFLTKLDQLPGDHQYQVDYDLLASLNRDLKVPVEPLTADEFHPVDSADGQEARAEGEQRQAEIAAGTSRVADKGSDAGADFIGDWSCMGQNGVTITRSRDTFEVDWHAADGKIDLGALSNDGTLTVKARHGNNYILKLIGQELEQDYGDNTGTKCVK